ncbi:endonuclease/exonuclease/phosphatase family protein [Actinokineospora sp.]|uniref:endonuclease/exonuclease/phosphatase family protein n=1 Tax=Actinokineospora sp. TaxID=1872133 RepID=UPI0040380E35
MTEPTEAQDHEQWPEEVPPRRRRRRGVTVFLALLVLVLLGLTVLRLGGFDGNRFSVAALAVTPYIAGFGVVVALLALVLRRRLLALIALVLALSLGVLLVPRYLDDGEPAPDGQRVRVMSANLFLGRADAATVVRFVRDARVDVLVLQELTPKAVAALDAAGLADLLPYRVLRAEPGASGGGILARVPLRQIVLVQRESSFQQPGAVLDLSGPTDLEIVSVHTVPPVSSEYSRQQWQAELAALPSTDSSGRPRVLAGDFNATLDHRALNAVLDRGYFDGAELAGEGMRPTWSQYPFGPPVTIDHILVDRRVGVPMAAVYDLPGSDHNAVLAELALPRP